MNRWPSGSLAFISYQDRKAVAATLNEIYQIYKAKDAHSGKLARGQTVEARHERKWHHLDCEPGRSPLRKVDRTS